MDPIIGASLIGGVSSFFGGRSANKANAREARLNREFQERMSNTAHQREAKDLEAAGLNRILSVTRGSGAATPAGATATQTDPVTPAISTAMQAKRLSEDLKLLKDQQFQSKTAAFANNSQGVKNDAETLLALRNAKHRDLENQLKEMEVNIYKKYPWLVETNVLTGGSTAGTTINSAKSLLNLIKKSPLRK